MSPLAHHLVRLSLFFGVLFVVGLIAALNERREKLRRRTRR
jgi:hypothetical protein